MKKLILFLLCMAFAAQAYAQDLNYYEVLKPQAGMSADEIMKIMYHNKYSLFARDYALPDSEVFYIDKSGFTRKKLAERYRIVMGGKDDVQYKDLVVVTYPTHSKGLAILTWTYEDPDRDQDVWLWIPSLKKVRKISASEDDDAFMGSDLTVEEVSTRRFKDETYTLLGEENFAGYQFEQTGEMKFQGKPCFKIEAIPKKPHWYYSKRVVWIDKETGGNIFEEYYDKIGKVFKTRFIQWEWYEKQGRQYATQTAIECKDLRTGHRTVIFNRDQHYDEGVDESKFTLRSLQRSKW